MPLSPERGWKLVSPLDFDFSDNENKRNWRVLISSHNPVFLDALPDGVVLATVFCYRSPTDGSSLLVRLQDIPDYPELIAQGSIGHLMTRGLLERFVKQHPGTQEKKRKAMEWLNSLALVGKPRE